MASGRERSVSIYTLLHLVFHRRKPVEAGIKGKKKKKEEDWKGGNITQHSFLYSCVLHARAVLM